MCMFKTRVVALLAVQLAVTDAINVDRAVSWSEQQAVAVGASDAASALESSRSLLSDRGTSTPGVDGKWYMFKNAEHSNYCMRYYTSSNSGEAWTAGNTCRTNWNTNKFKVTGTVPAPARIENKASSGMYMAAKLQSPNEQYLYDGAKIDGNDLADTTEENLASWTIQAVSTGRVMLLNNWAQKYICAPTVAPTSAWNDLTLQANLGLYCMWDFIDCGTAGTSCPSTSSALGQSPQANASANVNSQRLPPNAPANPENRQGAQENDPQSEPAVEGTHPNYANGHATPAGGHTYNAQEPSGSQEEPEPTNALKGHATQAGRPAYNAHANSGSQEDPGGRTYVAGKQVHNMHSGQKTSMAQEQEAGVHPVLDLPGMDRAENTAKLEGRDLGTSYDSPHGSNANKARTMRWESTSFTVGVQGHRQGRGLPPRSLNTVASDHEQNPMTVESVHAA
eukprot:gnl/MRDRNA2_/MRDRNA2_28436_c0_seq1.p1 gnl/MRDRNA2_/MRDRNA2_28436_c0~~gnl/MRDRNA2_/MRDRNA2_28436_c0_seq1.p1  ORF type:complete len:451 (+),score=58.35 gnl/MRDRNA2_/MRDRNA2_28436_c0_seq1:76-1428(+)